MKKFTQVSLLILLSYIVYFNGPLHQGFVLSEENEEPGKSVEDDSKEVEEGEHTTEELLTEESGPVDSIERDDDLSDYEDDPFYTEWNEKMAGFHPKTLLSLDIPPKETQIFYEDFDKPLIVVRGMFYTLDKEDATDVVVTIKSSSGDILYKEEGSDGIFSFENKMSGTHEFHFYNPNWTTTVGVTIAVGTDDHTVLQSKHIESTESRLEVLKNHVDSVYSQFKYLWLHNNRQMRASVEARNRLMIYAGIQFAIILSCSLICVTYVKRIVSNKRML